MAKNLILKELEALDNDNKDREKFAKTILKYIPYFSWISFWRKLSLDEKGNYKIEKIKEYHREVKKEWKQDLKEGLTIGICLDIWTVQWIFASPQRTFLLRIKNSDIFNQIHNIFSKVIKNVIPK